MECNYGTVILREAFNEVEVRMNMFLPSPGIILQGFFAAWPL